MTENALYKKLGRLRNRLRLCISERLAQSWKRPTKNY
jgi:hypothetical protein